ncbi:MAG: hypothetical protein JNM84_05930 [Planctomycetes bacterium]|nr:hypothetical protein [Planctomycetota bacterium]
MARGFARVVCTCRRRSTLAAFRCKGRGFCPGCGSRRMSEAVSPPLLPATRCRANSRNMHPEAPTAPQRLANYAALALLALTLTRTVWLALAGIQLGSWDVCITPALAVWAAYGIPRKRKDAWIAAGLLAVFAGVF